MPLVEKRLRFLFAHSHATKILKEIHDKDCREYGKFATILEKYVDPVRFAIFKTEIATHLQTSRDPSVYLEYYVPGSHEHVVYSREALLDESVASAIITRIITSIDFQATDMVVAGYQINNIDHIFALLEYLCSYDKLLAHLAFSAHYSLLSDGFYPATGALRKDDLTQSQLASSSLDLIKHCFRDEELDHIAQTLTRFEDRLIYFEPLEIGDDSILSDGVADLEDELCRYPSIYIELSDSDDDAIEIISVDRPVFDLTESVSSDGSVTTSCCDDGVSVKRARWESTVMNDDDGVVFHDLSSSDEAPTTSATPLPMATEGVSMGDGQTSQNTGAGTLFNDIVPLSVDSDLSEAGSLHNIDCPFDNGANSVDFIYQPRSVTDFYEYLMMSKNVPDE